MKLHYFFILFLLLGINSLAMGEQSLDQLEAKPIERANHFEWGDTPYIQLPNPCFEVEVCGSKRIGQKMMITVQVIRLPGACIQVIDQRSIPITIRPEDRLLNPEFQLLGHDWNWLISGPDRNNALFKSITWKTYQNQHADITLLDTCRPLPGYYEIRDGTKTRKAFGATEI